MKNNKKKSGFVIASELVFVLTIGVIGMVVGFSVLQGSLNEEYSDLAASIGAANQSWTALDVQATDGTATPTTDAGQWEDASDAWDDGQPTEVVFADGSLGETVAP